MNEDPDKWHDDLLDREKNPDIDQPAGGIVGNLRDEAAGRSKDFAADKAKDAGKKIAKEAGKTAAKTGAKAGAQAGTSAAAGSSSATAAGAGIAATTGVETAGVGAAVGAAVAVVGTLLTNKKTRNITLFVLFLLTLGQILILITVVLTPIIVVQGFVDEAMDTIRNSTVVRTGEYLIDGASDVAGAIGDTADAVTPWDGAVPFADNGTSSNTVAQTSQTDGAPAVLAAQTGSVQAATARNPESRLSKLFVAMRDQGYFKALYDKYGFRIRSSDNGRTYKIYVDKKLIKTVSGRDALKRELKENEQIKEIFYTSAQNDLHVFDYTQRVTMAEKGMKDYSTAQLFVPGANEAETPEQVTSVRKKSLETQNNPFLPQMTSDLSCVVNDCGTWVADTVSTDATTLTESISQETGYRTKSTLYELMKKRLADATEDETVTFWDWYRYVGEIAEAAKLEDEEQIANNSFIQGVLKTRKEQAGREWMHWRTVTDQYKTGKKMTDESATALFTNFEGGAQSKAYRYLSGQTGGVGFKDYEKLNDNRLNPVKTIYEDWQANNAEPAAIVTRALNSGLMQAIANSTGFLSGLFGRIFSGNEVTREAFTEAGFELGSQIMIPVCDGSKSGTYFLNCLYAGAEGTARDIGISDYGFNGAISQEEYNRLANYMDGVESNIAAKKPLLERLTSLDSQSSFARTFFLQATIPLTSNKGLSSITSYLATLPSSVIQLATSALNPAAHAAEVGAKTKINNVDLAGIKLSSLISTPLSSTLNDPAGSLNSCPITQDDQENLCRTDETTYLALAAKFDLLPSEDTTFKFTVGSYNILHAVNHAGTSNRIGGCDVAPVPRDPNCSTTRSTRQAQIITGQTGTNPALDIVGLQEVSPGQFRTLKSLLPGYQSIPSNTSRMSNSKDGGSAIFWNSTKLTKFDDGKMAAISNTSHEITQPWVGLQSTTGQKIYVTSAHYPTATFGGDDTTIRRAARLTMDWVKSKATEDTIVIVVGDFNDELDQRLHYCVYTEESVLQHVRDMEQGDAPGAGCSNPDTDGIDHIYATPRSGLKAAGWTHMARTGLVATASDHEPVYTNLEVTTTTGGTEFIIGTYNQKNRLSQESHDKAVANILSVPRGGARMDVVGTQETGDPKYQRYKDALSRSNYGVFPDYNGGDSTNCAKNTSIFYNQDKFTFVKGETFKVPRYPDAPASCGGGERTERQSLEGYANGLPNVWANIPLVWLQDSSTGQMIIVINTHNVANVPMSNGTRPAYSRYVAARIYVEQVRRLKSENRGTPIFFTGDFNEGTGVREPPRNATHQGKVENLLFCMFAQNGLMKSAAGPEMRCGGHGIGGVDYIYVTPEVKVDWHDEMSRAQAASDHPVRYAKVTVEGGGSSKFRIATFNILHVGTDPFERQWRTRMPISIRLLKDNEIVVAGLQEVRPQQHDLLTSQPYATDTYAIFPRSSQNPHFSPNPVIWNKHMYELVEGKTLPIEYDSGSRIDHAVLVRLKDRQGNEFYVLNTHDPANARPGSNQQNALSRLKNARFYRQYLADLAREGKPIFLTGDFNSRYTMNGNQQPYNNQAENLTYCVISSGGVMKNVWDIFQRKAFRCPRASDPGGPIDHIYTAHTDGVKKVWTAPARQNGSDHPTVMAEVVMPWAQNNNDDDPGGHAGWSLPLPRSGWESDGQRWLEPHGNSSSAWTNGIVAASDLNIGSGDDDCGKPVYSMLAGTVVSNPPSITMQVRSNIGGRSVLITYAHGNNMKQGGTVRAGQQIMTMGKNGNSSACHLHLEISYNGRPVCPQDVFPLVARNQSVNLASLASRARTFCR